MIDLNIYVELIRSFLSGNITASVFEGKYLKLFKSEENIIPHDKLVILYKLFEDVDAYCDKPELMDNNDIDEKELKKRCESALKKLIR